MSDVHKLSDLPERWRQSAAADEYDYERNRQYHPPEPSFKAIRDCADELESALAAAPRPIATEEDVERVASAIYVAHVDHPRITKAHWPDFAAGNQRGAESIRKQASAALRAMGYEVKGDG